MGSAPDRQSARGDTHEHNAFFTTRFDSAHQFDDHVRWHRADADADADATARELVDV
jgi:hypothetical protein